VKVWEIRKLGKNKWFVVKADSIVRFRTLKEAQAYCKQYADRYVVVANSKEYVYPGLGLEEQFIV
jgi:hypothetical protein